MAQCYGNKEVPDNLKEVIQNITSSSNQNQSSNQDSSQTKESSNQNSRENRDVSSSTTATSNTNSNSSFNITPEMMQAFSSILNGNSSSSNSNQDSSKDSTPNIDIATIMKMKTVIDKLNSKQDDPRANLLLSLKPYLKESRKSKVEQYVKLLNMGKVVEIFNPLGGDKPHDV